MKEEIKKQFVPVLLFVLLGGMVGLAAAKWMAHQKKLASENKSREKIEALYDIALASAAGNFGYANAQLKSIELTNPSQFLLKQTQRYVQIAQVFEAAESNAAAGNLDEAIAGLQALNLDDIWQEPLSSFKQKRSQRLQNWKRQRFVLAQEAFVLALERGDEAAAKKYLETLGSSPGEDVNLAPMKKQLETLLEPAPSEAPATNHSPPAQRSPKPKPRKIPKNYLSNSKAQAQFVSALEDFRQGSDEVACQNLKTLVDKARPQSVWWEKAQSFLKRKCH
ncbi:MAG: hypothetical protein CMH56_08005 [Myxococcales bacterium]|nr:hypothetical protein [Myxococcales bacterium]|tara:strand:- start:8719 stop:9555 length:837 start_codon:yes stop_codon:yes gene_type:complete